MVLPETPVPDIERYIATRERLIKKLGPPQGPGGTYTAEQLTSIGSGLPENLESTPIEAPPAQEPRT